DKYFDTVTDTSGVNNFAVPAGPTTGSQHLGTGHLSEAATLALWQIVAAWQSTHGRGPAFSSGQGGTTAGVVRSLAEALSGGTLGTHSVADGHHAAGKTTATQELVGWVEFLEHLQELH